MTRRRCGALRIGRYSRNGQCTRPAVDGHGYCGTHLLAHVDIDGIHVADDQAERARRLRGGGL